jgi:hypothetical protein
MDYVENRTFDEIEAGDSASLVRTLTRDDISLFAVMSGDVNPGAQGAGIVLGARVPIILTSRTDSVLARMASCAVALVAARRGRPVAGP